MSEIEGRVVPTVPAWGAMRVRLHTILSLVHRYVGLVIAMFLVSAGLTGSLLTWNSQLERFFAPGLFVLPPHVGASALDPFTLRKKALEHFPGAQITGVGLSINAEESVGFSLEYPQEPDAKDNGSGARLVRDDQIFLDPVTGAVLGTRRNGDIRQGLKNFMPFVYDIHENLVLGDTGNLVLGVVALLWVIMCLTGGYLTLPVYRIRAPAVQKSWLRRWIPSWKIRPYGDFKKINFDLHRAGGLWFWALLLVFAMSAMSFNLGRVYLPVLKATLGYESTFDAIPEGPSKLSPPALELEDAYLIAKAGMERVAIEHKFRVLGESLFMYYPIPRLYDYRVNSTKDVGPQNNDTRLFIDADTGRIVGLDLPTGVAGNTFTSWIEALHEAQVFGTPYRVFETAFGIIVASLSCAGVIVWFKKKRPGELRRMLRIAK